MVHALREIRRVLVDNGVMIDLRPMQDRWPIEIVSAHAIHETGRVHDFPSIIADDEAANRAMRKASDSGWFIRDQGESFSYYYSWDTPSEMEEWIESEWQDFIAMDEETKRATRSAWALADADARVCLKVKMSITSWKVLKGP